MIDAAIVIHGWGLEQHGEKFNIMPAARREKGKRKAKLHPLSQIFIARAGRADGGLVIATKKG